MHPECVRNTTATRRHHEYYRRDASNASGKKQNNDKITTEKKGTHNEKEPVHPVRNHFPDPMPVRAKMQRHVESETSAGLNRNFLMFLCEAYEEQNVAKAGEPEDYRTVLHLDPRLAPITVAVLPLMKKDGLAEKAKEIQHMLKEDFVTDFDVSGTVGKRYRRQVF